MKFCEKCVSSIDDGIMLRLGTHYLCGDCVKVVFAWASHEADPDEIKRMTPVIRQWEKSVKQRNPSLTFNPGMTNEELCFGQEEEIPFS